MKQLIRFSIITIFCLSLKSISAQHNKAQILKEINKIIYYDAQISYEKVPGFILGVIIGDSTYIYDFGSIERNSNLTISDSSIFEIGGISKVITSNLAHLLVKEGVFDYKEPINTYLPQKYRNSSLDITIKDIVTHTTGLPRLPHGIGLKEKEANNPYAHYSEEDFFEFYKNFRTKHTEKVYQYSHVGFALLEYAIEHTLNKDFEDVMIEKLMDPLEMDDTRIDLNESQLKRLSIGHNIIGKKANPWTYKSFEASVGIKSTMIDLLKFSKMQIGINATSLYEHLKETQQATEHTAIDKNTYIGLGWHIIKKKHCEVVAHSGSTAGHRAFIGMVDNTDTAVVILSNSENGMSSLGYLVLKMLNNNWKKVKKRNS